MTPSSLATSGAASTSTLAKQQAYSRLILAKMGAAGGKVDTSLRS
eukprot:CAMPEP_0115873088 /NCGR_PEP_ID=MMETSP0287-20121206/23798_1 /TAXON_ID=412157 /ORGANISM="Chrysochromulina rotalis, Strain UIO044" /LENGTH=44 /DNA_ID= /DNA_START= /DNA_END= /DNA_ORIENTATION=